MPAREFWAGKRVLVTGHTGFKGGWLCLWLQHLGARVLGYALAPSTSPSFFAAARVSEGMTSMIADVRDLASVCRATENFQPEIVIHMAAQPLVRYSYANPVETYATNVMGTVHLLEAVRKAGCASVLINVTSDKCYENRETLRAYREDEPMGGFDPYSSSKGCAELVTAAYRRSFFAQRDGLGLASVRAGNVIGGGDWAEDRLVPDLVRGACTRQSIVIRNPRAIRPWQHVLEPLHGYMLLAEKLWNDRTSFAQGWNFGPEDLESCPVGELADRFAKLWGGGASWRPGESPAQLHEAHCLRLDSSKARARLGWRPRLGFEHGLRNAVLWYQSHLKGADMREYSIGEIAAYESASVEQTT